MIRLLTLSPLLFGINLSHAISINEITGNLTYWDSIFASRTPSVVLSSSNIKNNQQELSWPEGPVWFEEKEESSRPEEVEDIDSQQQHRRGQGHRHLLFSDTIQAKIFDLHLDSTADSKNLTVVLENSGDAPLEDIAWMAEPGSNGMAWLHFDENQDNGSRPRWLVICQHGARRIALLDLETGRKIPLVTHAPNGERLNGPNDVIVNEEIDGTYIYFTDPVYAWLEKERFEDLPYLDDRVKNKGPGYCGVYRSRVDTRIHSVHSNDFGNENENDKHSSAVELIAKMDRPNGIGILKRSDTLVVSDCCQGTHNEGCQQGISRWTLYKSGTSPSSSFSSSSSPHAHNSNNWTKIQVIEDRQVEGRFGCADGFKAIRNSHGEDALIASCAGGLCLVDIHDGKVVARLWTSRITSTGEEVGCRISNVLIATDRVFLTGNCGILQLLLQTQDQQEMNHASGKDEVCSTTES